VRGQIDTYLRVVVAEVLRDVQIAAWCCLLRHPQRLRECLVQRDDPLTHQLPALARQQPVRDTADGHGGSRADPARLQGGIPVLPQVLKGLQAGVGFPADQVGTLTGRTEPGEAEDQALPPCPV
jgi:hypothetical protein